MALVGYARVSTVDQDTALQQDALRSAGVLRVFRESGSGIGPRPELQRALSCLAAGDTLVVWKLDRVARSLSDLLGIRDRLKASGASIRSLTEPLDTSSPFGEFTFQVLGAVAELERSMIRERVMAGQAAAKARGKRWGRRRALSPDDEAQLVAMYLAGGRTMPELAELWGVGLGTVKCAVYRVVRPDAPYLTRVRARA
ncbi:recombinase family protein [Acidovorax sp. SDU_ACID1]|uniref:recombinase family protein n=1 Tax=Acidovorax sp. SDU_ACID1 TaxID=3136632 RepID=UPI0038735C6E